MEIGGAEGAESPEDEPSLLLSNVEVLELLQKNLAENRPSHRRWKNRDWVQTQVVQYLQSTPCTRLDPSRRQEFQSLLESRKRRAVPSSYRGVPASVPSTPSPLNPPTLEPPFPDDAPSSGGGGGGVPPGTNFSPFRDPLATASVAAPANASSASGVGVPDDGVEVISSGFGLARSEALQILNFMPSAVVELHLLIDDLDSRFTEAQQNALLETISKYTVTRHSLEASAVANAAAPGSNRKDRSASEEEHADGARFADKSSVDRQIVNGHS